jgi:hypothetical protein
MNDSYHPKPKAVSARPGVSQARTAALILAGIALAAVLTTAQTPKADQSQSFSATSDNITGAKDSIKIDLHRWSTDEERDQVASAWTKAAGPAPAAAAAGADAGRGGRGRGGPPAARLSPEDALTAALGNVPTVGTLWSSEITGYSIHYAYRAAQPDGGEIITLVTDRRLGASNTLWRPVGGAAASPYEFSVIELHLNSKGEGEGKASITGKVAVDGAAKTIGLENYGALPVVLRNVKRGSK